MLKDQLTDFINNPPEEYALAAREAVNNRKQRLLRHNAIKKIFDKVLDTK